VKYMGAAFRALAWLASIALLVAAERFLRVAVDWQHLFGRVDGLAYAVDSWELCFLGLLALLAGIVLNPFLIRHRPRWLRNGWAYAGVAVFVLLIGFGGFMFAYVGSGAWAYEAAKRASGAEHLRLLTDAAAQGHPIAANNLGAIYANGRIDDRSAPIPVDDKLAAYWIENARVRGQPLAALNSARFLFEGKGVPIDRYKAVHALLQATESPSQVDADKARTSLRAAMNSVSHPRSSAITLLALDACDDTFCFGAPVTCADECNRVQQATACDGDAADSRDLTRPMGVAGREFASLSSVAACASLAMQSSQPRYWYQFARGLDAAGNHAHAAEWARKAAEAGHAAARLLYGAMLRSGRGTPANPIEGRLWLEKAAHQGHPVAAYEIGLILLDSGDPSRNPAEALTWIRNAATQGLVDAELKLGSMHRDGIGTAVDDAEAMRWFVKAAAQNDARAEHAIGMAHLEGRGVLKDAGNAHDWFLKSAERGHAASQYQLGVQLMKGEGIARNEAEAARWIERSANNGFARASWLLSWLYWEGTVVPKDPAKAGLHLQKAAEAGIAGAQGSLGAAYLVGNYGMEKSLPKALPWLRKAAEQGNDYGQYALGLLYAEGYGVTRDRVEAAFWLGKAAQQGHAEAGKRLQTLR